MKTECDKFFFTHPRHKFVFQETKKGSLEISPRFPLQTRQTKETELNEFGLHQYGIFKEWKILLQLGWKLRSALQFYVCLPPSKDSWTLCG